MPNLTDELILKKNLKIGLFGLGKSNLGVLDYIKKRNSDFTLTVRSDKKIEPPSYINAEKIMTGAGALAKIDEDILFLSPSVRRERAELSEAKKRGVIISSDAELFFERNEKEVIAVTGADGKSTTTYLISRILSCGGIPSAPAGNFGVSLTSFIGSGITAVAELSSFQLTYMKPRTKRAVITNITPNHLNWHASVEEYISAKLNVTDFTDSLIIDYDSKILNSAVGGKPLFSAVSSKYSYSELSQKVAAENYMTLDGNTVRLNGKPYFDLSGALRRENYNVKNYMLALSATLGYTNVSAAYTAINSFKGLPHRAETVTERDGIKYINSSIDSSPERTLKTLGSLDGDTAVIIGGLGKGLSLEALAKALPRLTKGAALMGEVGEELSKILKVISPRYRYKLARDMKDAINVARDFLSGCGTVLLSPAATSFDLYRNFEERGNHFKKIVLMDEKDNNV